MSEQNCSLPGEISADAETEAALDVLALEAEVDDEPPESEPHAIRPLAHAVRQITAAALRPQRLPGRTDAIGAIALSSVREHARRTTVRRAPHREHRQNDLARSSRESEAEI